ncbi:hypothetical protein Tco_0152620 [Tanacetum coccineum]
MRNIKMTMSRMQLNSKFVNNMLPEWGRFVTAVKLNRGLRDSNYDQLVDRIEDMVTMHVVQVQLVMGELRTESGMLIQVKQGRSSATTATENRVALDEEQLLFLSGGHDNALMNRMSTRSYLADSMLSANLSSADPVYDERWSIVRIRTFYLSTTTIQYQDAVFVEHHEEHEMHDDILKEQRSAVVQSHVSSVPNDAYMMIYNDMYEPHAQSVSKTTTKLQKLRAENGKIKQHYKEMYDSIKITRAKNLEHTTALLTKNESLKVQIQNKLSCVNKDHVKPKVLAPGKYVIDVEPIPPRNRNNREVHLVYLNHLKESVETLREIVEEAKVERPLDSSLALACRYTKHS